MSMAKKKKPGRPRLRRGHDSVNVTFRCTERAKRRMQRQAKSAGLVLSDWLREQTGAHE